MTELQPTPFLLFAAGEPDRGDDGRAIAAQLTHSTILQTIPRIPGGPVPDRATIESEWQFPVEHRACVRLVTEIAETMGRTVTVIDVNWPQSDRALVERWIGPNTLLPSLISPRGLRLEGLESFVPSRVRRFLEAA